jgi:hypothetical protein
VVKVLVPIAAALLAGVVWLKDRVKW